jgi:hypothetical protein
MPPRFAPFLLAASALTALPVAAGAQSFDFTPYNARILSDPAFLPLAGQFEGATSYNYTNTHGTSFDDVTGAKLFDLHRWSDTFTQSLAYGITDDLSVNAQVQYDPFLEAKHEFAGGGETVQKESGFTDPSFGVTWRALDQAVQPVNLDLFASYSPDWLDARAATNAEDGTLGRGGREASVGAALSRVTRDFTLYGSFAANFLGRSGVDNPLTGAQVQTGSHTNYTLALESQTRFTDALSLNAGVAHTWQADLSVFNTDTGIGHSTVPGNLTNLHVALNYHLVPNTLVASLTYGHDFLQDSRNIFPAGSGLDGTTLRDRNVNIYGAKLSYAFP